MQYKEDDQKKCKKKPIFQKTVLQFCSSSVSLLILSGSGGFGGPGGGFGGFQVGSKSSGKPPLLLPRSKKTQQDYI